ncbi:MAG: import inner rane translocase subunit Tim44, partial [Ramlibacter sp.]|nr:import inner rane translocase subunit Tim44 [Ramlibacter sp.]
MKFWSWIFVAILAFGSLDADAARRLGGGGSVGKQSSNVSQREAARPAPGAPANANQASPAAQPAP